VVRGVLDATVDVLARVGYEALTFDAVARGAGVSRTTLYRRWRSKRALVGASVLALCEARVGQLRDTGSLCGDLLEIAAAMAPADARERQRSAVLLSVLSAEHDDRGLAGVLCVARERVQLRLFAVVERAIGRGELPPGVEPALVIEPVLATLHLRRATAGDASAAFAERLVDLVVAGARAFGPGR
jgi:AcrR family transcriptional regulator